MRLLFVLPYVPTPVRRRPFEILRTLSSRGHGLTLACLQERQEEDETVRELERMGIAVRVQRITRARRLANLALASLRRWPLQAGYDRHPALARDLSVLASKPGSFDAVHVEHLRGASYGLALRDRLPVLWDAVDSISRLFEQAQRHAADRRTRAVAALELPRTRRFEAHAVRAFSQIVATSREDANALRALALSSVGSFEDDVQVAVVPNGVDLSAFRPPELPRRDPATILMTGKMSYHANVAGAHHLVNEVMPLVWASAPEARVVLAGAAPARSLRELELRHPGLVDVTGAVPDLLPMLQTATVSAAPMPYGVGIQNKVLEAMACATPVVARSEVVSDLTVQPGQELLVGRDAPAMANGILGLIRSPERAAQIGQSGRRYVERCHGWADVAGQLECLYQELGD